MLAVRISFGLFCLTARWGSWILILWFVPGRDWIVVWRPYVIQWNLSSGDTRILYVFFCSKTTAPIFHCVMSVSLSDIDNNKAMATIVKSLLTGFLPSRRAKLSIFSMWFLCQGVCPVLLPGMGIGGFAPFSQDFPNIYNYRISPCISREIYPRTKYYTDNSSYTRVTPSGKKLNRKQVEFSKFGCTMTRQWWAIMHELMNFQSPH